MADEPVVARRGPHQSPAYWGYRWAWSSLDWLFPPRCGGCGRPGSRWCGECQSAIQPLCAPLCPTCGQGLPADTSCSACQEYPPNFTALRSWAVFVGPLRAAVHRLKYSGDLALGEVLARPLIDLAGSLGWPVDVVIPVPLSPERQAERGFNQAGLLARPLALALGATCRPQALLKLPGRRRQVGLHADERRANAAGAYQARPGAAAAKTVLLVDDVTTTGATLDACAQALLQSGAKEVYAITLARAALNR